ncbi:MAG: sodium:solute symporter [Planctomycetota bacterium]|nr:MAG: sodium:solute symporter [Planctomycetota bacterium]
MSHLNNIDYTVIAFYVIVLISLGLFLRKMASASLEDYFLGGKRLPWWALGISRTASFLDITGTMIITSFLFMLGPRGLFIEFRGGAALVLPFLMAFMGKWHRRSNCMTGAEWNVYRFGAGIGGQAARVIASFTITMMVIGMQAYMVTGVGIFLSTFLPLSPNWCAILLLSCAAIYTMASGFYGVVYTDLFQSLIILTAVIAMAVMATLQINSYDGSLGELAQSVTGNARWISSVPHLQVNMPPGYKDYEPLFMLALFYLMRNIIGGIGAGADPKFFGARNERECGKLSFVWTAVMMIRWPLMMSFAVLGLFMVHKIFPDQQVLADSAEVVREHLGEIPETQWDDTLAGVINNPDQHPQLVSELKNIVGPKNWKIKLKLVSYHSTVNPERILPAVLLLMVHPGFRGLIIVALIAASMSTFDSFVNMATGFFTRDIYQAFLRPKAKNRELIFASWGFIIFLVCCGFGLAQTSKNINDIWDWLMMGLTAGFLLPNMFKFLWWRFNAGSTPGRARCRCTCPAAAVGRWPRSSWRRWDGWPCAWRHRIGLRPCTGLSGAGPSCSRGSRRPAGPSPGRPAPPCPAWPSPTRRAPPRR